MHKTISLLLCVFACCKVNAQTCATPVFYFQMETTHTFFSYQGGTHTEATDVQRYQRLQSHANVVTYESGQVGDCKRKYFQPNVMYFCLD